MNSFMEMEWVGKWELENLVMYGSKISGSPKKQPLSEWGIEEEGEMDAGLFNLYGGGCGSGGSGSDLANGSSGKSSMSASTDSSPKIGTRPSSFGFEALKGVFGDGTMRRESGRVEVSGSSTPLEGSVGSVEPLIGLRLGKRTYFENSYSGGNNARSPSSVVSVPSTAAAKKPRPAPPSAPNPRCQVEGCNLDLSSAKEYHRKHRVCDSHSKCPKVILGGLDRRFCQQCSRFHGLSEFDEKKRSCRRRLSDHNARRRKPQQETIQFNSTRFPSSFYDGRQQMNFALNGVSLAQIRNAATSDWESTHNSKFTITREFPSKPEKGGGMQGQAQMTGSYRLPQQASSMHSNAPNGFLVLKGATSQVCSQGFKDSTFSSTVDAAAPEFRRALSLLSTTHSCRSYRPESISLDNHSLQTTVHAIPQGLPLSSGDYWPPGQQQQEQQQPTTYPRAQALTSSADGSAHLDEGVQAFRVSYNEDFYHAPLNCLTESP